MPSSTRMQWSLAQKNYIKSYCLSPILEKEIGKYWMKTIANMTKYTLYVLYPSSFIPIAKKRTLNISFLSPKKKNNVKGIIPQRTKETPTQQKNLTNFKWWKSNKKVFLLKNRTDRNFFQLLACGGGSGEWRGKYRSAKMC